METIAQSGQRVVLLSACAELNTQIVFWEMARRGHPPESSVNNFTQLLIQCLSQDLRS